MAEAYPTQEYKCFLCMKPYNQPRELPCNHNFYCSCLTSYIDKEHRTADEDRHYFPCPVCDTPTSPRDVNTDVDTRGTSFPINNLFINPTTKSSDDQNCKACQRVGESNPAVVWCTGCTEMLCKECRSFHDRNKMTAKHRLVPSKEGGFCDTTVNENCPNHEGNLLEFYCLDHSSMCCNKSLVISHKKCKSINDVIKTGQPLHETELGNIKDESTKMLKDDESEMTLINNKENEVSMRMTRKIQQAKDKLDGLNTTFQSELAGQCKVHRQQLTARMKCVKKFQTHAENSNNLMTRFDKQGTDGQRLDMGEKKKQQLSGNYRRMDQNTKRQPNTFDLKLNIATVVDDIMKMTTIGNVDVISNISSTSQNADSRVGTLLRTPTATSQTGDHQPGSKKAASKGQKSSSSTALFYLNMIIPFGNRDLVKSSRSNIQPTVEPVKTEYSGYPGSSVTLQCHVEHVEAGEWQCPNSSVKRGIIKDKHCLLKIPCMDTNSLGKYTCKMPGGSATQSNPITLRILQLTGKIVEFEGNNVQFRLVMKVDCKECKWTYINDIDPEKDITTGQDRYEDHSTPDTSELTIKDYRKEDNGIYICRDKETDEQLAAYSLDTKYNVKVELTFMQTPQDEEIVRNLIDATEQLLQTLPNHVVDIGRPGQRPEADSHRSHQMKVVAYLIKQRNAAEFEEMEKRELETLYIMYLTNNRSFPDLPFNRKHIAINFTKYPQYVKCSFYDDRQKDVWNKFLEEYTSFK